MENSNNHQEISLFRQILETHPITTSSLVNQPQPQEEEEINLRQLIAVIKHRWLSIAVITIMMTGAAVAYSFLKTPIYEGRFLLLIGKPIDDSKSSLAGQNEILDKLGGEEIDYDTQIQVLISPELVNPVIKKVAKQYPDLEYEDLIKKKGKSPLSITQLKKTKILEISYKDEDPEKIKVLLDSLSSAYMKYSAEGRKTELNQGLDLITDKLPLVRQRVNGLQKQMQKLRQSNTFIDPQQEATRFSQQFQALEQRYIEAQVALSEANSRYQILQQQVGLDPNQAIIATYLSESPGYQNLLKQLQAVEIELAQQSAVYLSDSPIIKAMLEKRANLLPLLEQEAQRALGNKLPEIVINTSPSLVSESQLRLELTQQLVDTANQRETLQIKVNSLGKAVREQEAQIKQFATLARQYSDIQRELEVSNESLTRFLEEQQKLELKVAQQVVPWQIISPPKLEEDPVSPKPVRNIALGVIGGLLLGLGAAFLRERLDPVYHTTDELKENTQLPILGAVPWQKELSTIEKVQMNLSQIKVGGVPINFNFSEASDSQNGKDSKNGKKDGYYGFSAFKEAFRTLTANIQLLGSDIGIQSLALTSVMPAEGKTTCAVNLAKSAATMGKRVLLIDCDLRRPRLHERLELPNEQGLTDVLAKNLDLYEAIQPLSKYDQNLWILTGGETPPDPIRLLTCKRLKEVMAQLQQDAKFDLILWDMPPSGQFADARILATQTTGIILVTKIGKTDRFALKNLIEELKMSQIPILGVIANNADRKKANSYYYYGYGYGSKDKTQKKDHLNN